MESGCEYFKHLERSEKIIEGRYGYVWKDGKLYLYEIIDGEKVQGPPISYDRKPMAVLTPRGR